MIPAVVKEAYHCCFLFAFIGSSEYIEGTAIVVALVYVNLPEVNVNPTCSSESFKILLEEDAQKNRKLVVGPIRWGS